MNRPGATVLFRHGYYGRDILVPLDRRAFQTLNRVAAAGYYDRELREIPVTAKRAFRLGEDSRTAKEIAVSATVDLSSVPLERENDRRVAALHVAVFCADDKEALVGESWQSVDLRRKKET